MTLTKKQRAVILKMRRIAKKAEERAELARIYLLDGAPHSAARCYREAADLLDQWGSLRSEAMGL